jgi:HAMP domain-containing protein
MPALLTYLPALVLAFLWIRYRPLRTQERAALHWILGVVLLHPIPDLLSHLPGASAGPLAAAPILLSAAGAVILAPALWYFAQVDRKATRWILWSSGALFLSTYRSLIGGRLLRESSDAVQRLLAERLAADEPPPARPFGAEAGRQAVLWRTITGETRFAGDLPAAPIDSVLAIRESSADTPLLWDGESLWLRARVDRDRPATRATHRIRGGAVDPIVRIEALAEVDSLWLARVSRVAGDAVGLHPGVSVTTRGPNLHLDLGDTPSSEGDEAEVVNDSASVRPALRSIGPPKRSGWRIPGGATIDCLYWSEAGWSRRPFPIASWAGLGEQVGSLFSSPRENPFSAAVIVALGVIALLFLGTLGVVASMVLDMGRSITRAVQALTQATRALQAGQLDHRISVQGDDELWKVADSFNEMADGLEKIRGIELAQQSLEEEMRLARAIQTRLLPAAPPESDRLELAGLSLPAREVGGDYYDYLQLPDGRIGLAVADVSGKGTPAALLMSAFRAALRSQDLGRLGPAETLGRINRFIHESVDPGKFITAFLALIDPSTGDLRYANAGHDAPIVIRADNSVEELTGGGLILGMLPQIVYDEAQAHLEPADLLAVFTDGVTEARNEAGDFFGPERMVELLRRTKSGSCSSLLQQLVHEIEQFAGDGPQADDITVILARRR